jgi:pyruvate kinase
MDVARLNFSHGTHEGHRMLCSFVRTASEGAGRAIGVLADLQGPRIRFGAFRGGSAKLTTGDNFVISAEPVLGSSHSASTTYALLADEVGVGDEILVDDGMLRLRIVGVNGREIQCQVIQGGIVSDHKGLNLPGVNISAPALTAKDVKDLRFALGMGVDLVALSFVRRPSDVEAARAVMEEVGNRVPILAKLERPEAVADLGGVLTAFDGLMIARGDLGVELPLEQVPLVQKRAIQAAREQSKPVIVATQMLESMTTARRPTRAEVSDVANAILDGADALMLSAETSVGLWPVDAVKTMDRVIIATEQSLGGTIPPLEHRPASRGDALARGAVSVGATTNASALVAFTQTGATARRLSALRHSLPLLVFTPDSAVQRQLALSWGVESFVAPRVATTDEMMAAVNRAIRERDRSQPGENVVVVAGAPPGGPGSTNTIRVHDVV